MSEDYLIEKLHECEYGVFSASRADGADRCGEPATHRFSWDGGKTWLYVCGEHAAEIEKAELLEDQS